MGYNVKFSKDPDIIVCGSILGFNVEHAKIWGAGFHTDKDSKKNINKNLFYAVRGNLSLNMLNLNYNVTLGDPGLLLSRFFKPKTKKVYDICIISHFLDYDFFKKNYRNKFYIINMGRNNVEDIANSINKCNFIFSSSLHGIIFSHSLGIPAVHLENTNLYNAKNYKFKDYYSILDIPYIKEELKIDDINTIIKKYNNNKTRYKFLPNRKIIKKIQDNLLAFFPYKNNYSLINKY